MMRSVMLLLAFGGTALAGDLPNKSKTPGAVALTDLHQVCHTRTSARRNVDADTKKRVFASYGIKCSQCGNSYEIDHLVPLELGGSNDIRNLWPQSYLSKPWNAHVKDKLETRLHKLACAGKLTLLAAQQEIRADWILSYQRRMN